jgi:intracellular multiplication protein IcmO
MNASYDGLKAFTEGQAVICFGDTIMDAQMYYSNPGHAKAMRVTRYMALRPHKSDMIKNAASIARVRDRMVKKNWTAERAAVVSDTPDVIAALVKGFKKHEKTVDNSIDQSIMSIVETYAFDNPIDMTAPTTPAVPTKTETPPPEQDPATKTEAVTETTSSGNTSSGANPMGMFKKKPDAPEKSEVSETPAAPEVKAKKSSVATEALDILKKSGKDAAKTLLKETDDA